MNSWKQPPKQALVAQYVDCYWFLEKMSSDTGVDYPKLNPDPSATLIIAPKNQSYHFDLHNNVTEGMGCHMLMPNTSVITMDHTHPFLISGIKFKVGAVYSLNLIRPTHWSIILLIMKSVYPQSYTQCLYKNCQTTTLNKSHTLVIVWINGCDHG